MNTNPQYDRKFLSIMRKRYSEALDSLDGVDITLPQNNNPLVLAGIAAVKFQTKKGIEIIDAIERRVESCES